MNQAFILADKAFLHDDVPIGAVIVHNGKIVYSADTKKYMSDSLKDMGQERENMRNQAMQGSKELKNTSINDIKKVQDETNKRI